MAVSDSGVFIAGFTQSNDLPGTTGAAIAAKQAPAGYVDAFIARFSSDLTTLDRATYYGIAADNYGGGIVANTIALSGTEVFIGGTAGLPVGASPPPLPGIAGGAQATHAGVMPNDGFVARLNLGLTAVNQATYFGGTGEDGISEIALNGGDVYAAGITLSTNLPFAAGGAQPSLGGVRDTFVTRISTDLLGVDTIPDAFTFTDQVGVPLSTVITSNVVSISGLGAAAPISVTGGEYRINAGAFTTAAGTISNGSTVQVRHTSAATGGTATNTTLTVGGVSDTFTSTTLVPDTTPDAFSFTDQVDVARSTVIVSNTIAISGINAAAAVSVTGGEYSINGGAFTAAAGSISNGNTVAVRHTSSASFSTATNTTLTVGGVSDTFTSTTLAADTTPDAFSFTDQAGVPLNTVIVSNVVAIAGINTTTAISVTGGEYSINAGAFTAAAGTVSSGNTVVVRHTSAATGGTATNTTLTVGGVSDTFTSTTLVPDTTPDAFSFTDQADVALSTVIVSNSVTISGINTAAAISVTGGEYSINAGPFTGVASTITSGNTVVVRHTSSASGGTATNTTLTVGGVSDTFTSTTLVPDTTPNAFSFTDQTDVALGTVIVSNSVTISGINTAAAISVTGGEYRINLGAFTATAATVSNGDTVQVRHTSSASGGTATNTTLTVGGVSDTFTSTTLVPDTTPDAFSFADQTGVALSTVIVSNSVAVSGINTAAPISVAGGEYSINAGPFTSAAGTISNGNTVRVRHTSAAGFNSTVSTTLTLGGIADTFSSTTLVADTTPDAFAFVDQVNVPVATIVVSNSITVSGINTAAAISVSGGEYSVNGGAFSATASTVANGATVRVRHVSAAGFAATVNTSLTIGGITDTFSSLTVAADSTPDAFAFVDQAGVALSSVVTSNAITVTGINTPAAITVSGGEYSIDGGAFTAAAATVAGGSTVRVRHTSSASFSTATNTTLAIGGVSDTFTSTTLGQDTTPDDFTFVSQAGVPRGSVVSSNTITVAGINAPAGISIVGGEYSVNGGAFTSAAGTVNAGDTVQVRVTSSAAYNSTVTATTAIGGVSKPFAVTTEAGTVGTVVKSKGGGGSVDWWLLLCLACPLVLRRRAVTHALCALLVAAVLLPVSQAGAQGFYAAAGLGQGSVSVDKGALKRQIESMTGDTITSIKLDDSDMSWHARIGYAFNGYVGIEAAYYDFGEITGRIEADSFDPDELADAVSAVFPAAPHGGALQGRLGWPFSDEFSIGARAGIMFWNSDETARLVSGDSGSAKSSEDGSDFVWGIDLVWQHWSHFGLTLEMNRVEADDPALSVDIGLLWKMR